MYIYRSNKKYKTHKINSQSTVRKQLNENDKKEVAHHGKVAVQEKLRQDKRRDKSVRKGFYTFDIRPIIRKMKISVLVFYLAVIFGSIYCISCRVYSKEDVNLIGAADGNYDINYFNVSLERSLSRHKRASTLFPFMEIAHLFRIDYANGLIKAILNFIEFIIGLLTGQEGLCPIEKLSIDLIGKMILHPIQITEAILCHIFNIIGKENRAIIHKLFNTFSDFLRTIFLPGLHATLNRIAETGILPSSLRTLVEMFNVLYNILRLVGYVK